MRKPSKAKLNKPKAKVQTKAELLDHIRKMRDELQAAQQLITMMQNEIKEVVILNKSLTRTVENLSKRDC